MRDMKSYRTVRTSVVVVAVDGRKQVYPSVEAVPEELRSRLVESTSGTDSGRILIADLKGRDLLLASLRDRLARREATGGSSPGWVRTWGALLFLCLAGLTIWLLVTYR